MISQQKKIKRGVKMGKNVGAVDQIVRGVIAIVFLYLGYAYSYWFLIVTILLILTIITGYCWPYTLLGINTAKKSKK
mgnify:CR=1 FL=1